MKKEDIDHVEVKIKLNRREDGSILMKDNPELAQLSINHMIEHDPDLFSEMRVRLNKLSKTGASLKEMERDYLDSPKQLKQRIRLHKIKFIKWLNVSMINKEDNFEVPTIHDPNKYGEKLYD